MSCSKDKEKDRERERKREMRFCNILAAIETSETKKLPRTLRRSLLKTEKIP